MTKVLKFRSMGVAEKTASDSDPDFQEPSKQENIKSIVACLMISLMICHFVFIIFEVVYN